MDNFQKYKWKWDRSIKGPYILLIAPNQKTIRKRVYMPDLCIYINKKKYYLNTNYYNIENKRTRSKALPISKEVIFE